MPLNVQRLTPYLDLSNVKRDRLILPERKEFFTIPNNTKLTLGFAGLGDVTKHHSPILGELAKTFTGLKFVGFDSKSEEQLGDRFEALRRNGVELDSFHQVSTVEEARRHLGNIQAVIIGTPTGLHFEYMQMLAESGVLAVCEKPGVLPWQLAQFESLIASKGDKVMPIDFMKGSPALRALGLPANGFVEMVGKVKSYHSRFVETTTLEALIGEYENRPGLGKVAQLGAGTYFDMVPHNDVQIHEILKVFGVETGFRGAQLQNAMVADGKGLNSSLGSVLKDPHADIYGFAEYDIGGVPLYRDAGKGLGNARGIHPLKEWCFATLVEGEKGILIISTGTDSEIGARPPFVYVQEYGKNEGIKYTNEEFPWGYQLTFDDVIARMCGETDAISVLDPGWHDVGLLPVRKAVEFYNKVGTIDMTNGEEGDLSTMQKFEVGSFPERTPQIYFPPYIAA